MKKILLTIILMAAMVLFLGLTCFACSPYWFANLAEEKTAEKADEGVAQDEKENIKNENNTEKPTVTPAEDLSSDEQNKEEQSNGSTIPAGTYRGKTDMPDNLSTLLGVGLPGKILHNEITVIIREDGTVTGGLLVTCFSDAYRLPDNEDDYTFFTDITNSGNLSGSINDVDGGTIKIKMVELWKTRYGGDVKHLDPVLTETSFDLEADIHISDYDMYGYVDGYRTIFTFKALKD